MTRASIYYSPFKPLLWLCGCFPTKPRGKNPYFGVEGSIRLLQSQGSIFIFPEGRCIPRGTVDTPAHTGVIRIHQAMPETPLLLCHIEYNGLRQIWRRNVFSVAFKVVEQPRYSNPQDIMKEIYAIDVPGQN